MSGQQQSVSGVGRCRRGGTCVFTIEVVGMSGAILVSVLVVVVVAVAVTLCGVRE